MKKFSLSKWNKYKQMHNDMYRRQCELSIDRMDKIKKHSKTNTIQYPQHKEAFDYVDESFPEVEVKKITIYECDKGYLDHVGLKGIGGCYNQACQTVVISSNLDFGSKSNKDKDTWGSIVAKISTDEVIVHELLHYVSLYKKKAISANIEEEFAYGNSVGYLRNKGQTDDTIVINTFLPYFMSAVDSKKIFKYVLFENGYDVNDFMMMSEEKQKRIVKKLNKELFEETRKQAIEMAHLLITVYDAERIDFSSVTVSDDNSKRFGMMDFS